MKSWPCDFPETSCIDMVFLRQFPDSCNFAIFVGARLADVFRLIRISSQNINLERQAPKRRVDAVRACSESFSSCPPDLVAR
jgi:hypothetical protein